MKDEYLWQRTGTDPELEKLERELAVFRYREATLQLPVVSEPTAIAAVPGWRISWPFAFAASMAAVLIAATAWFQISSDGGESTPAPELVFVAGPEIPLVSSPVVTEPGTPEIVPEKPSPRRNRTDRVKANPTWASARRPAKPRKKDGAPKDAIAALTEEERYAYRQLLLALSITGSKLKIVQDTIEGTDDIKLSNQR